MPLARSLARPLRTALLVGVVGLASLSLAGCASAAAPESAPPVATDPARDSARDAFIEAGIRIGDGPVVVTLFGDSSCPYCAKLEADTGAALASRIEAGEITLVLHPMTYVSQKHGDATEYSTRSAALLFAAADAGETDAVLDLYRLMLEQQPEGDAAPPTDAQLLTMAADAGIETDLSAALSGDTWRDLADRASDFWFARTLPGTTQVLQYVPTVVVDGTVFEMIGDGTDLARLQQLIDDALAA
ncbi:thioredoxin domain-containing protein [Microbacterium sp. BWT-B31]|uniref:DsbA family protein n=1 Tax=Microbacterium sp. BWT-B31 TaxID=3232072 RepID=UPI0035279BD7